MHPKKINLIFNFKKIKTKIPKKLKKFFSFIKTILNLDKRFNFNQEINKKYIFNQIKNINFKTNLIKIFTNRHQRQY